MDDAKFKADLEEVKKLGGDGKAMPTTRTPEQAEMGLFWLESSPLKWGRIARTVANDKGLDLWDSARLMAIMQMGLADGYHRHGFRQEPLPVLAASHRHPCQW